MQHLQDFYASGLSPEFLDLISLFSVLVGIFVIITKNPVVSVLHLILLFVFISGYLFFLGLSFIAISYLLVYVGAVSILFIFILMLINIRISELVSDTYNDLPLALITSILFMYPIYSILPNSNSDYVKYATSNNWDGNLTDTSHITAIGNIMYTSHNIWLIITSIILLLAMVGAIVITINPKQ